MENFADFAGNIAACSSGGCIFAGGMELVIRLKWGILAAWGILLAGIFAVGKETGGKKGEDEEENGEGLGDHVPGGRGAGAGGIPEAEYSGAAKHFFQEERDQNDRGSQTEEKTGRKKTRMRCIRSFLPGGRSIR